MQSFLPGVSRYFETPDLLVLPIGICGTEDMFGIGEQTLGAARITMNIGRAIPVHLIRAVSGFRLPGVLWIVLVTKSLPCFHHGIGGIYAVTPARLLRDEVNRQPTPYDFWSGGLRRRSSASSPASHQSAADQGLEILEWVNRRQRLI